jgi:anti-sigma factor RsiW
MNSGRSPDVRCDEILAAHSDYLDGQLPASEAAKVQWHLATCAACGRYDRVVRRGAELARELPAVEPSDDFAERLQHRLFHVQDGPAIAEARRAGAGVAATMAMVGVIALVAWSPLLVDGVAEPAVEFASVDQPPAFEPVQLTDSAEPDLWTSAAGLMPLSAAAMLTLRGGDAVQVISSSVPGPYSPLIVEPPMRRPIRTISIE